jgi:protein O-mannosyl-transferase
VKSKRPSPAATAADAAAPAGSSGTLETDSPAGGVERLPAALRGLANHNWLAAAALIVGTFLAYLPMWHAGFIWDDDAFLTTNALIRRADGLYRFWFSTDPPDYFPLTSTSLWLEWRLWGAHPLGYHLVNVLLHALSAVLWWRVLARLKLPGAWLAAAIFALHPVNVESVAWITERKNTLTMFFYALSLLLFLRAEDEPSPAMAAAARKAGGGGRPSSTFRLPSSLVYWLSVLVFLCALLSKTSVTPLPLVLLGLAWWRRGQVTRRDVVRSAPFFGLAVALGLVTMWFQAHCAIGEEIIREDGWGSRLAVAGCAVWFYLYKALLPMNLSFVYPRWQVDAGSVISYVPLVLLLAALWALWRYRERWGRGWLLGLGYYVLLLLPVLGFVEIYFMKYALVADHWQYFAMVAVAAAVGVGLRQGLGRWGDGLWVGASAGVLIVLGALTGWQTRQYADEETLWKATLAQNLRCYLARANLGAVVLEKAQGGDYLAQSRSQLVNEAVAHFKTALELKPDDPVAHNNLGNALFTRGEVDAALAHVRRSLELQPANARAHTALGNILLRKGQTAEAIAEYRVAVQLDAYLPEARYTLGYALFKQGDFDEAILHLRQALPARRSLAEVHNTLGQALQQKGLLSEALLHFQQALRHQPRHANAHNNLGTILFQMGQTDEAIEHFKTALAIQPNLAEAHYNLGNVLYQLGKVEAAIEHLRRAQQLQPENASAHNNLGSMLLQQGHAEEAAVQFELALKLRPDHAVTRNNLGRALLQCGKPEQAGAHFLRALEIQPAFPEAADNLRRTAWILATSPQAALRNGAKAVEFARHLDRLAGARDPVILATLAAACAEAGRYDQAATNAQAALVLAEAQSNTALAAALQEQIGSYRAGAPFRHSGAAPVSTQQQ